MIARTFLVLALSLPAAAQQICLAEGTATSLQITTIDESNPNGPGTVVLQDVEFLPIELTGRTLAREHDATRARRIERNGLLRIELPDGGRVLRYRRVGGQFWGFLHVARDGSARVVLEQAGLPGNVDPFMDRVAIADDGAHGAVGLLAGGMFVFKLDGTVYPSTGRPDRLVVAAPKEVEPTGVMVGPTHVFYATDDEEIFRCSLADGAVPFDLTPPPVPNVRIGGELAMSRDGQHVVFLYGPQHLQQLWHAGTVGAATLLPPPAAKYEDPNYLPEGNGGPAMLLNDDGTRLFFVDASLRDELYLLDLQGTLPTLHVTDDPIFEPYIGVYILPKFDGNNLLIAIGDLNRMDWYRSGLSASGGTVQNLTATGTVTQPYFPGTLDPRAAADAGNELFVLEQRQGGVDLRRLDVATGSSTVVQQGASLTLGVGTALTGPADILVSGSGGDRLYVGGSHQPFATTPAGIAMTVPSQGIFAATWVHLQNNFGVPVFYLPDGTLLPGAFGQGRPQIAMTAADGVVIDDGTLRYIALGVDVVVQRPPAAVRLVLSGAGV
ncbi:MAG: hypothetical protein KDE27_20290 [Planctomycetes bacterium]|nr:hypothetical protein [Planctomycetota bacterium]